MGEQDRKQHQTRSTIPGPYQYTLIGGIFILMICASVLLYQFQLNVQPEKTGKGRLPDVPEKSRDHPDTSPRTGDDRTGGSTEATMKRSGVDASAYPFTVRRRSDQQYVFRLHDQIPDLTSGTRVQVSLYWNEKKLEQYSKKVSLGDGGQLKVEWSPGDRQQQIPPGVYRIRITGSKMLHRPLIISRFSEYLSEEELNQPGFRQLREKKAIEYAVSVGSADEVRNFHTHFLCELKKRGRSMISAWRSWLETARSSYNSERTKEEVAQDLFDRFLTVHDAVRRVREWIEEQEASYAVLPYQQLRGQLLKLSYVLSTKVNAMSMTVLKQVGISPFAWPSAFVQRGFGANINVLRHMSHYDRETMQEVETVINNTNRDLPYSDLTSYALHRLRRLFLFINQLRVLDAHPYREMVALHLSGSGEKKTFRFRSLHTYTQELIRISENGLSGIVPAISHDRIRTSFQKILNLLPEYATVVLIRLANTFDLPPSKFLDRSGESRRSPETLRSQIQKAIDRLASSDRVQSPPVNDCE